MGREGFVVGDRVVLRAAAGHLPPGAGGVVIGFYMNEPRTVLVRFDVGEEPLRIDPDLLAPSDVRRAG